MAVYNGEKYLREAIDSILNQTFTDFEFIIINDGSTDSTKDIILSYNDKRIKLINNEKNLFLATSLNKGIKLAKGKYIARMDADDISLPERFEIQYKFMEENQDIDICGTWFQMFGDENRIVKHPETNDEIKFAMFNNSALGHPTIIFNSRIKPLFVYEEKQLGFEDYKLWLNLAISVKISNIQKVLLKYRWHNKNMTQTIIEKNSHLIDNIRIQYIKEQINVNINKNNAKKILTAINTPWEVNSDILTIDYYFRQLIENNKSTKIFSQKYIYEKLKTNWQRIIFKQKKQSIKHLKLLFSPFYKNVSSKQTLKFIVKCLINYEKR